MSKAKEYGEQLYEAAVLRLEPSGYLTQAESSRKTCWAFL